MAGKIKSMIDAIIEERAQGNRMLVSTTKTKLMLKGIDYNSFDGTSADDPAVIAHLEAIARDFGLDIRAERE